MIAKTAETAIGSNRNGSFDPDIAARVVSGILRSQEPEEKLLNAIVDGALPDQVGLELAEVFGEIVRVSNLDNSVEVITSLSERSAISTLTEQILFLAIIEMATQEEVGQIETGDKPVEVGPVAVAPSTPMTDCAALIRSATELQQQFGTVSAIPADKLEEIRRQVENLPVEEFASLRQFLSSVIIAQAELTAHQRQVDVAACLAVVEILLRQRQRELTAAIFAAYETLHKQGFRLRDRDEANRPLVTITSTNLIRNRYRAWLDTNESSLGDKELSAAENTARTLEKFLVAAAHESVQEAIQKDLAARLRERIIRSGVQALDNLDSELVTALPQTKKDAIHQVQNYLDAQLAKLRASLRNIGSKTLVEADATLGEILNGYSLSQLWQRELAALEGSDYNPANQKPELSPAEKRFAFFEVERKKLSEILGEIEKEFEKVTESRSSGASLKKLDVLRSITLRKIADLDQLISPLRPQTARTSTGGVNDIPLPPPSFVNNNSLPPVPPVPVLAKEASNHG